MENSVKQQRGFDAIVVGSGISGGWAAKELCEKGLKVLMIERGPAIEHIKDYPTAALAPWELNHRGRLTNLSRERHFVQNRDSLVDSANEHFWVNDLENPYTEIKPFDWMRGYQLGGRSLLWGRQCLRLSDLDFEANRRQGIGVDWPLRYKDLAPWYDYVENYIGVSGTAEGLPHLPDGKFLPAIEMNCVEKEMKRRLEGHYSGERVMTMGRFANLTVPHNGRGACMYRQACKRGCPYGASFSTQSSTLPAARATGNLTVITDTIVNSVIYDQYTQRATGVRVIDANTKSYSEYYAQIIFLNASTLGSTFILLNSACPSFPSGLGNSSGQLGLNLMDHHLGVGAWAEFEGFENYYYYGRSPASFHIPRYRNLKSQNRDYLRGYHFQGYAWREGWEQGFSSPGFGKRFKDAVSRPGKWYAAITGFGEMLPYAGNRVSLNRKIYDKWNQPTLSIDCEVRDNERVMRKEMLADALEIMQVTGGKRIKPIDEDARPGRAIHEMGTARMGRDPRTSVLNGFNQMHDVRNVFVTDGSCMCSGGNQNPSLTYMALTARACAYAFDRLKLGNL